MTNSRMTDPEVLENRYPVLVESFTIRRGSGGRGLWNGGDGVERRLTFNEAMDLAIVSNRRKVPPYGMNGGDPGSVGKSWIAFKKCRERDVHVPKGTGGVHTQCLSAGVACLGRGAGRHVDLDANAPDRPRVRGDGQRFLESPNSFGLLGQGIG